MASPKSTAPILHYNNSNHQKQSRSCSTDKIILITMASLIVISLVSLLILFSVSSASRHSKNNPTHPPPPSTRPSPPSFPAAVAQVGVACKATRYPDTCQNSLSKRVPENPTPTQVLEAAISVSAENLVTAKKMVVSIRDSSSGNKNRTTAAKICLQVLDYSEYRTQSAADALPHGKIKDARAWFSAALAYQYDCWSGLKYVNGTKLVGDTMTFLNSLMGLTSNALSMMSSYENYGSDFDTWKPPKTERDGFWEKVGSGGGGGFSGFNGGLPANLKEDVTVCKDGSCSYKTVQDAVNAAPNSASSSKFVIGIKEGVYEETVRVPFEKKNVVFLGDGIGKTVITGSLNVGQLGMTTYESATVGVLGDGFMASGLTFKNTAGPDAHQAVAFRSDSDLSVIEDCEFLGNQDTLYAKSLRQFYKKCRIQGNVDFIFGNSAAIFQDCDILIAPRQLKPEHGEQNAVTAHGRTDPSQATGYVFHNCVINGTEEYMKYYNENPKVHRNYLGRPWKEYSRTVFVNSILEILISPEGWLPWSGDQALKTLYYGEFGNSGPRSDTSKRVSWSSQIPADHVNVYSVENFIQGDEWISSSS